MLKRQIILTIFLGRLGKKFIFFFVKLKTHYINESFQTISLDVKARSAANLFIFLFSTHFFRETHIRTKTFFSSQTSQAFQRNQKKLLLELSCLIPFTQAFFKPSWQISFTHGFSVFFTSEHMIGKQSFEASLNTRLGELFRPFGQLIKSTNILDWPTNKSNLE